MSGLDAPPMDSANVAAAYSKRDRGMCHACGGALDEGKITLVHLVPGADDYPRNVAPVHPQCVTAPVLVVAPPPVDQLDLGIPEPPKPVSSPDLDTKVEANAGTIVGDWLDTCASRPPASVISRVGKQVKKLLEEGMVPVDISAGLAEWRSKGLDPQAIPSVVNEVINGSQLSTTDQRVAAGLKLAAHYREQGE